MSSISRSTSAATSNQSNCHSSAACSQSAAAAASTAEPCSSEDVEMKDTSDSTSSCPIPFPFPFPPYPQQYELMTHIFNTIEKGRGHVAIVESPTGTGKSLSLISSCLYWLLEHHPAQERARELAAASTIQSVGTGRALPDWVGAQTAAKNAAIRAEAQTKEQALRAIVAQQNQMLERRTSSSFTNGSSFGSSSPDDDEFLIDCSFSATTGRGPVMTPAQELRLAALQEQQDAESELLHSPDTPVAVKIRLIHARVERQAEMKRLSAGTSADQTDELGDLLAKILRPDRPRRKPQIIYASRTHSQLVQMVGEIKKLKYGRTERQEKLDKFQAQKQQQQQALVGAGTANGMNRSSSSPISAAGPHSVSSCAAVSPSSSASLSPHQLANMYDPLLQAKVISLGSRTNLCIRPEFAHLRKSEHAARLNDACLDLQKAKPNSTKDKVKVGCEFLHPESLEIMHDHVLAKIHDLEELEMKGRQVKFCPYYGSRQASPEADVLIVPYPSLLSEATRTSLGIELEDAIVVIDEAHNLHETINEIYSCRLTFKQLRDSRSALKKYLAKYAARLNPINKVNVELLLRVCESFHLALHHSHLEAHRQYSAEESSKSSYTAKFGPAIRELNDIFSDGMRDGIHLREKQAQMEGGVVSALLEKAAHAHITGGSTSVSSKCSYSLIKSLTHFNTSLGIEDVNYHHLTAWMMKSEICKKIKGFVDKEDEAERELQVKIQEKYQQKQPNPPSSNRSASYVSTSISPLSPVLEFMKSLSNVEGDGRVCIEVKIDAISSQTHPETNFRFLMLNPSVHLMPLLKQVRTIILAGGTMQPFDAFKYQLFPVLPSVPSSTAVVPSPTPAPSSALDRLHFFSCSHVVPPSHIQAVILRSGLLGHGRTFNFSSAFRGETARMDDLAATLVNLLNVIPQGVVVFFTSYIYASQIFEYWSTHAVNAHRIYPNEAAAAAAGAKNATAGGIARSLSMVGVGTPAVQLTWLERMRKKKCIFRDAQNVSFEETLDAYTRIIQQASGQQQTETASMHSHGPATFCSFSDSVLQPGQTGALLFSVVGGKMSEGINFSDGLARAVVMVGVPYPNRHDPELREKTAYADRQHHQREQTKSNTNSPSSLSAGSQLIQTLTMRAVNQSIGRAIRHARDYASIILVDERYTHPEVVSLLPRWLKTDSFNPNGLDFRATLTTISAFFQNKQPPTPQQLPSCPATVPQKRKADETGESLNPSASKSQHLDTHANIMPNNLV